MRVDGHSGLQQLERGGPAAPSETCGSGDPRLPSLVPAAGPSAGFSETVERVQQGRAGTQQKPRARGCCVPAARQARALPLRISTGGRCPRSVSPSTQAGCLNIDC